ncbi:DUF4440 domain-containing protein [Hymenobacter sp. HMF4947]|uniref:DUF4440 domain-containing protein n=1 Tax=Hymenobacter ginkgonis TaxID=2682976 RepID=A0A7K1T8Y8_9BACT|nr:nuclear transport factor 2 family protein [Hymenobacter ginkgonis]MVN74876.1 DUF4440 domain-containing protein [Hymenobacter ginkgonis]
MQTSLPLLATATLLAFGGGHASVPAATRPAAAGPATMTALFQQFSDAMQQQDIAKATACLAKNVRLLGNTNALSGRDSLSTYWLKNSFGTTTNLKLTPLRLGGDASMGYATGTYTYDLKPMATYPAGASSRGSYMILGRKEGATWQIAYVHLAEEPIKANK